MTFILGLNAYHGDSAACILADGELLAAAEEERFLRIKHWAGFPRQAITYCLGETGITIDQVDHVAINRNPQANIWRKIGYTLLNRPSPALVLERLRNRQKWSGIGEELRKTFPDASFSGEIHQIEHHLAHLASAFLVSPFEEAVVVSIDGFGDFASTAWGFGQGNRVEVEGRVFFPHSLGVFYQAVTQYLGFPNYGDEYKVMGLAAYGEPSLMEKMRRIVRLRNNGSFYLNLSYFRHHNENVEYEWNNTSPTVGKLFTPAMEELLGPARGNDEPLTKRHHDIACSTQTMFEEAVFHLFNRLHKRYGCDAITVAGGCGFNSVANGRIRTRTPFKRIYIQSAAGDAGGAIGSAFVVWHRLAEAGKRFRMDHSYWGPQFSDQEISELLENRRGELKAKRCLHSEVSDQGDLCRQVAQAISEGKVVGWFQGRMEWGPRALGNRSILCDPRRVDMKDILNLKIKRRESFRPFAPSVLRDAVAEWFEQDDEVPFMMKVFQIKEIKRTQIPAVTHVDGSGRLQTVSADTNPLYYCLIDSFRKLTGVPMVLNTSFNANEPVVCRPEEALDCFLRTNMDLLILGRHLIERQQD